MLRILRTKFAYQLMVLALTMVAVSTKESMAASGGGEKKNPEDEAKLKEALEQAKKEYEPTNQYRHKWIKLPDIRGKSLDDTEMSYTYKAKPGKSVVIVFIASFCVACQELSPKLTKMSEELKSTTDFLYVFVSDQAHEAKGFAKEYKLKNTVLANHDILKDFHNPELPTIYIADRNNWITRRFINPKDVDLKVMKDFLTKMNVL